MTHPKHSLPEGTTFLYGATEDMYYSDAGDFCLFVPKPPHPYNQAYIFHLLTDPVHAGQFAQSLYRVHTFFRCLLPDGERIH